MGRIVSICCNILMLLFPSSSLLLPLPLPSLLFTFKMEHVIIDSERDALSWAHLSFSHASLLSLLHLCLISLPPLSPLLYLPCDVELVIINTSEYSGGSREMTSPSSLFSFLSSPSPPPLLSFSSLLFSSLPFPSLPSSPPLLHVPWKIELTGTVLRRGPAVNCWEVLAIMRQALRRERGEEEEEGEEVGEGRSMGWCCQRGEERRGEERRSRHHISSTEVHELHNF